MSLFFVLTNSIDPDGDAALRVGSAGHFATFHVGALKSMPRHDADGDGDKKDLPRSHVAD